VTSLAFLPSQYLIWTLAAGCALCGSWRDALGENQRGVATQDDMFLVAVSTFVYEPVVSLIGDDESFLELNGQLYLSRMPGDRGSFPLCRDIA
jgi:hypothetical protein